ncbi:hypothetical protein ACS7SF_22290 (plasmid) [Ralstonia sp. 25C]|uniref:hypothetical protein n=1 Tax=Ralstonia sp. 25C TaxID=3447363 RepID=UPI003F74E76D
MRAALKDGDRTTTGGVLISSVVGCSHHGVAVGQEGDYATCPACKAGGPVFNDAYPHFTLQSGKQILVRGAKVMCRCENKPLVIPSQHTMNIEVNRQGVTQSSVGQRTYAPPIVGRSEYAPHASEKVTNQRSSLEDHPELICPNMSNAEFAELVMKRCAELARRTQVRLNELKRWNAQDQSGVVLWFGVADSQTRQTLLDGLGRMLSIFKTLKPENFVRWSETSLTHVGCAPGRPKGETRPLAAAVCKPDTATHTIAIALEFCKFPEDDDIKDSQLLTLAHEVSHFHDTMDTIDDYYSIWTSIRLAREKSPICIRIADSVAGYIVVHRTSFPSAFGMSFD